MRNAIIWTLSTLEIFSSGELKISFSPSSPMLEARWFWMIEAANLRQRLEADSSNEVLKVFGEAGETELPQSLFTILTGHILEDMQLLETNVSQPSSINAVK